MAISARVWAMLPGTYHMIYQKLAQGFLSYSEKNANYWQNSDYDLFAENGKKSEKMTEF